MVRSCLVTIAAVTRRPSCGRPGCGRPSCGRADDAIAAAIGTVTSCLVAMIAVVLVVQKDKKCLTDS